MLKKKKTEEDVKTNLMYRVIGNIKKKMDSSKVTDTVYEKMTEKPNDKKYIYKNKGLKDQTYSISDINIEDDSIKVVLDNPVNLKVDDSSPYGTHYESFILEQRFVKELFAKIMGETNTENLTDDELDEVIDKVLDKVLDKKDIIQTSIDDTLKKDFNFGKEGYKGKQVVSYELSQLKDEKADIPRKSVLLGGAGAVTATIINGIKTYLAQNKATAEEQARVDARNARNARRFTIGSNLVTEANFLVQLDNYVKESPGFAHLCGLERLITKSYKELVQEVLTNPHNNSYLLSAVPPLVIPGRIPFFFTV